MKRIAFVIALATAAGLSACAHREAASQQEIAAQAGIAGSYAGTIPCADCPGIDVTLAFAADGSYSETMRYRERDASHASSGRWTLDADGKRLRLVEDGGDGGVRWMQIVSPTEVRMLDSEGRPIESPFDYTLTRQ